jgi:hypothetical protein
MASNQLAETPRPIKIHNHGSFQVLLEFGICKERFDVLSIRVDSTEPDVAVTPVEIRNLGLANIIREARSEVAADYADELARLSPVQPNQIVANPRIGPDSTRDLSTGDLMLVASLYMDAYHRGVPVQRYVAETLGIAVSTAARRIRLARQAGFISADINQRKSP